MPLLRRCPESAEKAQTTLWRAAHNPEVAGSSPVPATRNPLISVEIRGFSFGRKEPPAQLVGFSSYALAKSYERSELTTYQVTVMQKSQIEDDLPVYGRRGTRCRRKIFDAS